MSLDVYLRMPDAVVAGRDKILVRDGGQNREISRAEWDEINPGREPVVFTSDDSNEVFSYNITHNLNKMADAAELYEPLWRPDELGITKAKDLLDPLRAGLLTLLSNPQKFKELNPSNGWGDYDGLVAFVVKYIQACAEWPEADVSVWR